MCVSISRGLTAGPTPMRAVACGRRLAISASALAAMRWTMLLPASVEVSTEIERLLKFTQ